MRAIDGDALIDWIDPGHLRHPSELCFSESDVVNMINHAPTIEPERKKGKWIEKSERLAPLNTIWWDECSVCGHHAFNRMTTDFCPNCGADMRGEE